MQSPKWGTGQNDTRSSYIIWNDAAVEKNEAAPYELIRNECQDVRSIKRKKALGIAARRTCCYSCKRKFGDIDYIHKPDCHTPDEHISVREQRMHGKQWLPLGRASAGWKQVRDAAVVVYPFAPHTLRRLHGMSTVP